MTEDFPSIWDHSYAMLDGTCLVKIHEDFDAGLGGTLFDGSVALSAYIEHLVHSEGRNVFESKVVLELGAGCGFPGLFVAKLGAQRVILTDIGDHIELLQENIELNNIQDRCEARFLDWTLSEHVETISGLVKSQLDFILCADVVYSTELVLPLLDVLEKLCLPDTRVLFAHPKARVPAASELFWTLLPQRLQVEKIPAKYFVKDWQPGNQQFVNHREGVFVLRPLL